MIPVDSLPLTLAQIREELSAHGVKSVLDASVTRLMSSIISTLELLTRRYWYYRQGLVVEWSPDERDVSLWSPLYPIEALTLVEWYDGADEVTLVEDDDFRVIGDVGRVDRIDGARWSQHVRGSITGGYATGNWPDDVTYAVMLQARYSLVRNSQQRIADESQAIKDGGTSRYLTGELHPEFEAICRVRKRLTR